MKRLTHDVGAHSIPLMLGVLAFIIHALTNLLALYGYFRDELYYIACTDHPGWGYVDHPPLSILLLWLNRSILGDSLFALRFPTAVASAVLVYLTGLLVSELGGGKKAQLISCLSVLFAPIYLILDDFFSMNAFEPLFWMGAALVLIRILNTGNQRLWLLFGVIAGLGLQNKHSMAFFGLAVIVGLILTPSRREFMSRWIWLGGALAAVIALPNVIWQMTHNWATLEFLQRAQQLKNYPMSLSSFFGMQVLFHHPMVGPLWITGLAVLFFQKSFTPYRSFGYAYVFLFLFFVLQRGKPYYLSPIYPVILAAGAIALEEYVLQKSRTWIFTAYTALVAIAGMALLPMSLPLIPPQEYARIAAALGINQVKTERQGDTKLPQVLADRFGWREMTQDVARVFHSLTPEEQSRTAIYTQNYGEAGAIDFFGRQFGIPKAISGHNSYWLWGPGDTTRDIVIIVGGKEEEHQRGFESVELVAVHTSDYAMPYETNLPIYICRKLKMPIEKIWPSTKHFI
jgi:hypothetical protein